jgi:acyl-CoA synthetase (AMP-forming)/AMP-acid ligase II
VAILDAERADLIAAERSDPAWPRIVVGDPQSGLREGKDASFAALARPSADAPFDPVDLDPAAGGIVLFTSGTTGFPKAALLSQGAVANSVALSVFMGALQDRRYEEENGETLPPEALSMATPLVLLGPMFHLSGIMPVLRAVSVGTTIHIMGKWNADLAFDMIENTGMTRLSFVPAMLWDMLRSPRATPEMLGKVRYMMNGAAPLDPELVDEIGQRMPHCLIATTYGQTEVTSFTSSNSGRTYIDNPDTVGWACPTVNVAIRRDDGSEADVGEAGEIWVSSPLLMTEYVNNPEATAETLQDGWLASGDIGRFDENGLLTIVDRKKNMVISGGENIYCAEVERVLASHPAVREAIAYGRPDPRLGERVEATVVALQADVSEEALKEHCKAHLAIYKVPRAISFRAEALPRTASGKVDRGSFLKSL